MGSPAAEVGRHKDEKQHKVTLTKDFYIGETEVTQAQWKKVMGNNPSDFKGDNRPVECVSWTDCVEFCKKLTEQEQTGGAISNNMHYTLPTEAQWEYACRAGSKTKYNCGENIDKTFANYNDANIKQTVDVASYAPSSLGLYDMHGNVYEWCLDWYDNSFYAENAKDPIAIQKKANKVCRGGRWNSKSEHCRSAFRYGYKPTYQRYGVGFRVVLINNRTIKK